MRTTLIVAALLGLTACSGGGGQPEPAGEGVKVVVSHYPAEFLVDRVGGDLVDVQDLTSAGAEPHDVELSPQQVGEVQQADAVFYIAGFQPAVDNAVPEAQGQVVDLADGIALRAGGTDPHIWLDPVLMQQMTATVAQTLEQADPANREQYQRNAAALNDELATLDQQWRKATKDCRVRTMVVSHEAFGYLADQYGFQQKGVSGLTPEGEPSAAAIAELARFVKDNGVTTVYTETLLDPAVADTVAAESGARTATLDPLESPPAQGDYLSQMRTNLQTMRDGQSCA